MTASLAGSLAAVLAGAAVASALPPTASPVGRLRGLSGRHPRADSPVVERAGAGVEAGDGTNAGRDGDRAAIKRLVIPAVPLLALLAAIAGVWSVAPLGLVAALVWRHRRRTSTSMRLSTLDVALFADLVAGGMSAGLRFPAALRLAGHTCGAELRAVTDEVAAALDAGLQAQVAWSPGMGDPSLAMVARACRRTADSGAGNAAELVRIARRLRAERRSEAERRAATVAVWLVLPLGACFLPAFVLLTVVPIVVGLLAGLR